MIRQFRLGSISDPRLTDLIRLGLGEGFATLTGKFEGEPAFIVNSGSMADFFDVEDDVGLVSVRVFADETARDEYLERLGRTSPGALGVDPTSGEFVTWATRKLGVDDQKTEE